MAERGRPKGPDKTPIPLRLEPRMLDVIDSLARAELRARNGQIEMLLSEALTRRGLWPPKRKPEPPDAADDPDAPS